VARKRLLAQTKTHGLTITLSGPWVFELFLFSKVGTEHPAMLFKRSMDGREHIGGRLITLILCQGNTDFELLHDVFHVF